MNYYRILAAVDESLGRLLDWLYTTGRARDTLLLFMSDNGFMFGEHGLIDKRNAYEASIRIPLLLYAPGRVAAGAVVEELVANIDIAPTLLDAAGIAAAPSMQGRSLLPLARGEALDDWREVLPYAYYWEWVFPQTPTTFALRTDHYKLIQYHGIWDIDELYDLEQDPAEMNNLIHAPEHRARIKAMRRRLHAMIVATAGEASIPFHAKLNHGASLRKRSGAPGAGFPDEMLRDPGAGDLFDFADDVLRGK